MEENSVDSDMDFTLVVHDYIPKIHVLYIHRLFLV